MATKVSPYLLSAVAASALFAVEAGFAQQSAFNPSGKEVVEEVPELAPGSSISGTAYYDANKNGLKDKFELGPAGVMVNLLDGATGDILVSTSSDQNGDYSFTGIPAGRYYLSIEGKTRSQLIIIGPADNSGYVGGKNPVYGSKDVIVDGGKNPSYGGKNIAVGKGFVGGKSAPTVAAPGQEITGVNFIIPANAYLGPGPTLVGPTFKDKPVNKENIPDKPKPPRPRPPVSPVAPDPEDPDTDS